MLLIDSNLLLLWVVGSTNREWITKFKRTNRYAESDYTTLIKLVARFDQTAMTPNIATEVSNLLGSAIGEHRHQLYAQFATICQQFDEVYCPSRELVDSNAFRIFGLTDVAIEKAAERARATVLTDDVPLFRRLSGLNINVLNFANLRAT